jgi:hypothetical protein
MKTSASCRLRQPGRKALRKGDEMPASLGIIRDVISWVM